MRRARSAKSIHAAATKVENYVRCTQKLFEDITNEQEQKNLILKGYLIAHRNVTEN